MALKFIDGFSHYATADITKKWTSVVSGVTITTSNGRRGGGSLRFGNYGTHSVSKTMGANFTNFVLGFAINISALPSAESILIQLIETATVQITVALTTAGTLKVYKGTTAGTLLGITTASLNTGSFNFLEIKVKIDSSAGTVDLYKNTTNILNITGANTQNNGNAYLNVVQLGGSTGSGTADIDFCDLYMLDNTGTTNNAPLGDVRVETNFPTADGSPTSWTPSTGTSHYALVDEATPNTTDYISSNSVSARDSFLFSSIGGSVSNIYGVQVNAAALKDDAGARSVGMSAKSNSIFADSVGFSLNTSQLIYSAIFETDPNTSTAWNQSGLNAAEFGVRVAS